jgi:hypothetical protein
MRYLLSLFACLALIGDVSAQCANGRCGVRGVFFGRTSISSPVYVGGCSNGRAKRVFFHPSLKTGPITDLAPGWTKISDTCYRNVAGGWECNPLTGEWWYTK